LGSSAIVKVPEQVGAAKSKHRARLGTRFPGRGILFQENPRQGFPGPQEQVPKQCSQEQVAKQGSQEEVPKQGSQEEFK